MSNHLRVSCGIEYAHVFDISGALQECSRTGFDFITVPLVHPRFGREHINGKSKDRPGAFTRSDLVLCNSEWNTLVVGRLTPSDCHGCESDVGSIRINSEASLNQELTFASHLGLPAIVVSLNSPRCTNLARIVHNRMMQPQGVCYQVWVKVCMQAPSDNANKYRSDMPEDVEDFSTDTWTWWNKFHTITGVHVKIALALEFSEDLPEESVIARWLGEPCRCIIIPSTIFLTNKKGFPVLSKPHQDLVRRFHKLRSQFIINGPQRHPDIKYYRQYMVNLLCNDEALEPYINFSRGYEDYLQSPLQPLMENLESQTYDVFEKDPVKYSQYEKAMADAIRDRVPYELRDEKVIVLMVVGAGRGPLVRKAIKAAQTAQRKIKIYAVEKNPNAVVTLQAQQDENWGDMVTVVSCDMRQWDAPEKADIMVSELLGSFGDNELSPECLDGAQQFLKDDGVMIPKSYTSFICPIQSAKLYNEVRMTREKDKHVLAHFETPYVVCFMNRMEIAPAQDLFKFVHPNKDSVIDNRRFKALQFRVNSDGVMHGIAGYFESVLYGEHMLSIRPETHSEGMFSWFPILFPIREPIPIAKGDIIEINFWRCTNFKNVWYEWCITSPTVNSIHNPNGRGYTIGL